MDYIQDSSGVLSDFSSLADDRSPVAEGGSQLGNTVKSSPPPSRLQKRAERYEALSVARIWLARRARQISRKKFAGDVYPTVDCRYVRRSHFVQVHLSGDNTAHYRNLATCHSVWACPVCTAQIQQRRRIELQRLISWGYDQGHHPAMITFTFPHQSFETLSDLKEKQAKAFKFLRQGSPWIRFKDRFSFSGLVRSLELTYGKNGWHPHTHEIWLIRPTTGDDEQEFVHRLRERWYNCCVKAGLVDPSDDRKKWAFMMHAVDVRFRINDSDYLAKQDASRSWGADAEAALSSSKNSSKGVHPHEFLVRRQKGDMALYLEYVQAMKGSRQLFWSHGLKDQVGIDEVSDEEASEEGDDSDDILGRLSPDMWALIRRKRMRAQLLDVAETGSWQNVKTFLRCVGWVDPDPFVCVDLDSSFGLLDRF